MGRKLAYTARAIDDPAWISASDLFIDASINTTRWTGTGVGTTRLSGGYLKFNIPSNVSGFISRQEVNASSSQNLGNLSVKATGVRAGLITGNWFNSRQVRLHITSDTFILVSASDAYNITVDVGGSSVFTNPNYSAPPYTMELRRTGSTLEAYEGGVLLWSGPYAPGANDIKFLAGSNHFVSSWTGIIDDFEINDNRNADGSGKLIHIDI